MADITGIIVEVFKINCNVVQCNYTNQMEGLFYLLFFPSVFIILLIYLLVDFVGNRTGIRDAKLKLLLSIAFYAFIVFQGFFTMFISISQVWYIAVVILVGIYLILKMFVPGNREGNPQGRMPGFGAGNPIKDFIGRKAMNIITHDEQDMEKTIEDRLSSLESIIRQIKGGQKKGIDTGTLVSQYWNVKSETEGLITRLKKEYGKIGYVTISDKTKKYWDRMAKITKEFKKAAH